MILPAEHPLRHELHNEIHARPQESLTAPMRISYLALFSAPENKDAERDHLRKLCLRYGDAGPSPHANHFTADLGPFRIKWERHTEFTRYHFMASAPAGAPFQQSAISLAPADWLSGIKGQLITSTETALTTDPVPDDLDMLSKQYFSGEALIGSAVAGGAAVALTDFRIGPDGTSRLLIFDHGMTPRQAGRTVQRILEIDTYRMMALLALPIARTISPFLTVSEAELARIISAMTNGADGDDPVLLDRLTRLEADIQRQYAEHHYRFSAATAYYDLVQQRIEDLREERLQGLQTLREFMERRLAPAMSTCRSMWDGIESMSEGVARCTNLLSTRVGIAGEQQNQALLETMARRAKIQLRLQQTVEGLSVVAISYYLVGLVGYMAKALKTAGLPVNAELAMGISVPIVLGLTTFGIRNIRKRLKLGEN